jgi:hypothetical protein
MIVMGKPRTGKMDSVEKIPDWTIKDYRRIAEAVLNAPEIDWTAESFAGYLFAIMQPKVSRPLFNRAEARVPESDAEAISRVLDLGDKIPESLDDRTIKEAK